MNSIPLIGGNYYHIYNRGNNSDNIFYETSMLKLFSPKGMINSEQHVTVKKQ